MTWALNNAELILQLTLTHLFVSMVPLALGFVMAVIFARVTPASFAPGITSVLGAVYAIPSLALFVALPALIGTDFLGPTNVLIALTIYVISSMFFSARDAFASLPPATIEFARAQGLSAGQRFFFVELPLAIPGLIAGARIAAASTISMASIAAVVGVRNLGYLFLDGFQRRIFDEVFAGLLAIFVIAIVVDLSLWLVGRALTPWSRRSRV
jgi:osmoprotectant transport system permease protein